MSADLLRRAAEKLREHANAATPGPWWDSRVAAAPGCHTIRGGSGDWRGFDGSLPGDVRPIARIRPALDVDGEQVTSPDADAAHIALMHPPVALDVAELLEAIASRMPGGVLPSISQAAERTAREILREPQ